MLFVRATRSSFPSRQLLLLLTSVALSLSLAVSAHAATYYVATNGSDSNPGTQAAPFKTIVKASKTMSGGDTVYIRAGVYNEGLTHGYGGFVFKNGTSKSNMTRFLAYPGEEALAHGYTTNDNGRVIIKPPRGWMGSEYGGATFALWYSRNTQYIEVRGLVFDGTNSDRPDTTSNTGPVKFDGSYEQNIWAKNNLLINNEIRYGGGIGGGGGNEIIGNWIHHSGTYGLYTAYDNGLFEGNLVEDCAGYGLHLYQQNHAVNGWIVRNNIFRRNGGTYYPTSAGRSGKHKPLPGVIITRGSHQFYNNLVYDNPYGGINVGLQAKNVLVANNTVYGNGVHGIRINPVASLGGSRNARVINNIVWGNNGPQINDLGDNTTLQNNLTEDPKFVNPGAGDFGVQAGSPAIDKGATLAEVKTDYTGKARPEGAAYDIGAFEGAGSRANVLPGMAGGLPPGAGGGAPVLIGPNGEVCPSPYLPLQ